MKNFGGKALFLNRADINTDEIIPAKYLTEITKEALKPYLLEDLKLEGFSQNSDLSGKSVIVTKENFGCGSSREHAPWALEVNGINVVIAPSFARIFRQNMFNCGMMAIEIDENSIDEIFNKYESKDVNVDIDLENNSVNFSSNEGKLTVPFTISNFDEALVKVGGWVEYADKNY